MHSLALTFLDPLAGALAAGLAVPALLLLYFLKLRRRPVRVTASFLWQRAAEDLQVNTPFRWLRVSLVLLLQLLALLLLCAAIARPALSDLPPATGRVVVLLDASASMRATDADGVSRFDAAKREIAEFLGTLDVGAGRNNERTEVMLIAFAHEPRVLANFTTDRGELAAALDRAGPTDQPGDLEAALAVVDAFAAQSAGDEEGLAPTLVVISDGQDALVCDTLAVSAQEIRYVRVGPPESGDKQNAGVALLSARRDDADPATLRIFARLVNASSQPIEVAPVLEIDAAARRAERITIPGASGASPGERTITLETPAPGRALVTLRLPIADTLASDNAASVLVDAAGGVDVILVAPTGSVPGRAAPDVFLREAIEALEPRSLRVMTLTQHDDALASGAPLDADLLIYDRVAPTALPPVPSLSIGAAPPIEGLRLRDPDGEPRATRFLTWRRTDPLLRSVSLAETLVARPRVMTLPEVGAGGVTDVRPLAFGEPGSLIASITANGVERVIVGFDLAQSTWPLDVGFAIFLANAFETLAPRAAMSAGRSFTTGEPLVVAAATGAERVTAEGPAQLESRADSSGSSSFVSLGVPPLVGVYTLTGAAEADSIAPVNLFSAAESSIATTDALPVATRAGATAAAGEAAPREIWPWFVLAAVAFFVLEWLLFAWRMRV